MVALALKYEGIGRALRLRPNTALATAGREGSPGFGMRPLPPPCGLAEGGAFLVLGLSFERPHPPEYKKQYDKP